MPSEKAMRKLFALFKQKGLADRDDRLAYSEVVLERHLATSKDLTALDVTRVIEELEKLEDKPTGRRAAATGERAGRARRARERARRSPRRRRAAAARREP